MGVPVHTGIQPMLPAKNQAGLFIRNGLCEQEKVLIAVTPETTGDRPCWLFYRLGWAWLCRPLKTGWKIEYRRQGSPNRTCKGAKVMVSIQLHGIWPHPSLAEVWAPVAEAMLFSKPVFADRLHLPEIGADAAFIFTGLLMKLPYNRYLQQVCRRSKQYEGKK